MNAGRSSYLAARTDHLDVGIDAQCVRRIVPRREWDGPEPVDLDRVVHGRVSQKPAETVLVLDDVDGPCAVSTAHPLVVRDLAQSQLHELPPVLWLLRPSPAFLRIADEPGAPPLLILNHRNLAASRLPVSSQGDEP